MKSLRFKKDKLGGRQLKKKILQLLQADNFKDGLAEIRRFPARQAVGPLFSCLCSLDELVKWRAVTAMGKVISDLAVSDPESARVVMRRFIWNLNDESGGIGWGCPESMAEVMAQNQKLAEEYGCILLSYIQPKGNYLEHEGLQRGVLWGIGRLAHTRTQCMQTIAAWAAGPVLNPELIQPLKELTRDAARLMLYRGGRLAEYSVGRLAREALAQFEQAAKV